MKHFLLCRSSFVILLLLLTLAQSAARAQAPSWQAAINIDNKVVSAVATDVSGNVFIAGNFAGTTSFGATTMTTLSGSTDGFVAKWSPASNSFVWAMQVTGVGAAAEYCAGIAVSGNIIYVVGSFQSSSITFGNTTLTNQSNASSVALTSLNMYVAKLVDTGSSAHFVWGQSPTGGPGYVNGNAVAVNGSSVYVAGVFACSSLNCGGLLLRNVSDLPTPSQPFSYLSDIFVAKLTDTGTSANFVWAQRGGGPSYDSVKRMVLAGSDVLITGEFFGPTATFGSYSLTYNSLGGRPFMAKLTDAGTTAAYTWVEATSPLVVVQAVATNGSDFYLAGFLEGTATFGPNTLTCVGSSDMYVAKWSGVSNSYLWAVRAGGTGSDGAYALTVNGNALYVAGGFTSPTIAFGSSTLTSATSGYDVNTFVTKLTDGGASASFDWAQQTGGVGNSFTNGIAVSGAAVHVVGRATPPVAFGNYAIASPVGTEVGFLASLADNSLVIKGSGADLDLYPNPAHGTATILLPPIPGATATITVLDALGRAVRTQTVPLPPAGLRHELDLAGLAPGLYALRVAAGGSTATRRLVVE